MPRFYCPAPLTSGETLDLPAGAARHVQVLRLQPGDAITLFNGGPGIAGSGEFDATVTRMGRSDVQVQVGRTPPSRTRSLRWPFIWWSACPPTTAWTGWSKKPPNSGVASIQPVMTERSVLRLSGERADKKVAHWQSVAVAACEQCGGNRVPAIHPVMSLTAWLKARAVAPQTPSLLLSLRAGTQALRAIALGDPATEVTFLSGPEGGLSASEEEAALACGFSPVTLGPRVLRSETAALSALAALLI